MSSFLSRIKVKTGSQAKKNKFDLSMTHVTTQDFFAMKPVYIKEMVPGESIKIDMQAFTRLSPLVQPLYGSCRIVNRAFFVPMRTIYTRWNEFITQTKYISSQGSSIPSVVPNCKWDVIYASLIDFANATTSDVYDFQYGTVKYILNAEGKMIYNILTSLGYKLNIGLAVDDAVSDKNQLVSLMPLYAYAKVWCDWYANPAYDTRSIIENLWDLDGSVEITTPRLSMIFSTILNVCFNNDYFTSAWDNPVAPNSNANVPSIELSDVSALGSNGRPENVNNVSKVTSATDTQFGLNNGTPSIIRAIDNTSFASNITQYMLDAVHSVTDYVKRYQMVGSRAMDRYMAQYGHNLSAEKLKRSVYIGKYNAEIQISDVMQTSSDIASGTSLETGIGNYSGKGIGYGNGSFSFDTDEFGYLIITSYIEPKSQYTDGRPRSMYHLNALDFFNGDFDNLGVQAIRQDELCANGFKKISNPTQFATKYKADGVFGYTPRYAEYKNAQDNMSGDFLLSTKNALLEGWTLRRPYSPNYVEDNNRPVSHSLDFTVATNKKKDYNDIWQNNVDNFDHFYTIFRFNVDSYMPMKPMYDMYDYSNEDGKDLAMTVNGTQISD